MLDKNSKETLKLMNRLADEDGIIHDNDKIVENLPTSYSSVKLIATLNHLQDLEYLEFTDNLANKVVFLKLHHKGLNYKDIAWVDIKSFIIKSILVPIVISLVTTLIAQWLKPI